MSAVGIIGALAKLAAGKFTDVHGRRSVFFSPGFFKHRNIIKYGHDRNGRQRFKCNTCGDVYVETKNTVFYNRKLSEDQIILICKLLVEKNGIRAIERIMEIHRDTVSSIIEDLARHAREVTDFLIQDVGLTKIQVDEMWSFIKKTKEH
jgi:transposase-like protein